MRKLAMVMFALVVSVAACGGDGDSAVPPSGVSGTTQVPALTEAEKTTLCNWFADQMGGFGGDPCDNANFSFSAPADLAECLLDFPTCAVTVGVLEGCFTELIKAEKTCTDAAYAAAATSSNCQAANTATCL